MTAILDPVTELPVDLYPRVNALCDWLKETRVQLALVRREVATPDGLLTFVRLLGATVEDVQSPPSARRGVGRGRSARWWQQYDRHVRDHMTRILKDRVVRRVIAAYLVGVTGRSRHECLEELQRMRLDLETDGQVPS